MYEGEFRDDELNGPGKLYYPDGKRFEGHWKNGQKNGKGAYIFPNGQMFVNLMYNKGKKVNEGKLLHTQGENFESKTLN